jgi:hypothetical protein
MDAADAFWAARIASRFTDQMIKAIVETGELSDPAATQYLTDVIIKRRDKVVAYWLPQANPLDSFKVVSTATGRELTFDNAAVRLNLVQGVRYTVRWAPWDNTAATAQAIRSEVEATGTRVTIPSDIWGPEDEFGLRYVVASISTSHPQYQHWASPVVVTVRNRGGALEIVGIDRPTDIPAVANRGR